MKDTKTGYKIKDFLIYLYVRTKKRVKNSVVGTSEEIFLKIGILIMVKILFLRFFAA
jgi:hypothetical protein